MKLCKVVKLTKLEAINVIVRYKTEKLLGNGNFGEKERDIGQLLYDNQDQICNWDSNKLIEWLNEHKNKVALDQGKQTEKQIGSFDYFEIILDKTNTELKAERDKYKKALEFYRNTNNYNHPKAENGGECQSEIEMDYGQTARWAISDTTIVE